VFGLWHQTTTQKINDFLSSHLIKASADAVFISEDLAYMLLSVLSRESDNTPHHKTPN